VFVSDPSHGYQDPETPIGAQLGAHQPVAIGSGSWIGHGAIILPGTTIGWSTPAGGDLRPVWSRAEVEAALGGTA